MNFKAGLSMVLLVLGSLLMLPGILVCAYYGIIIPWGIGGAWLLVPCLGIFPIVAAFAPLVEALQKSDFHPLVMAYIPIISGLLLAWLANMIHPLDKIDEPVPQDSPAKND